METINVVFSSDNNYAQFMGVAICSIFENKKGNYKIDIYILDGGISNENKDKLKIIGNQYDFKINYIKINTLLFKDFKTNGYLTQAAYYRILIPELLPNLNKILYFDCDIIVLDDIFKLYNTNISNYLFAAVEEPYSGTKELLGMPANSKYFNSGVMILNLKKWREQNISKILINYIIKNSEKLKNCDQDALNALMHGKWLDIPYRYNYIELMLEKVAYKNTKKEISVIHFAGIKPWNYFCMHPMKEYYFEYLKKTPWRNNKFINKNIRNIFIKQLRDLTLFLPSDSRIVKLIKKIKRKLGIKLY